MKTTEIENCRVKKSGFKTETSSQSKKIWLFEMLLEKWIYPIFILSIAMYVQKSL